MPLLALLLACAYKPDQFAVDMATATCQLYEECGYLAVFGFDSLATCESTVQASYDPEAVECPEYDGAKAEECVEGVQAMTCDQLYAGTWPQACTERCGYSGDGSLGDGGQGDGGTDSGG